MHKKKILIITNICPTNEEPNKGLYVWNQVTRLKEHFDLKVFSTKPKALFSNSEKADQWLIHDDIDIYQASYLMIPKIGTLFSGKIYYQTFIQRLTDLRKTFPFDLIICYWTYPEGFAAVRFAKEFNVPIIIRPRGSDINLTIDHVLLKNRIKKTLEQADLVIPVSEKLRQKVILSGVKANIPYSLLNGINVNEFHVEPRHEAREILSLNPDQKMILFVGNLIPIKGIDLFMAAILLCDQLAQKDFEFCFIGSGNKHDELNQLAKKLQHCKLRLIGEVEHSQLIHWMNASDILCLPSLHEGCPNVILEAFACGLPVVATDVGGVSELVKSESLGILVPPGDEKCLADVINQAVHKNWDRQFISQSVKNQTWDQVADRIKNECEQLIDKGQNV